MINVGQRIRKHREEAGVSQKKLGLALGLSDKAVSAYESGRTLPPLETLFRIAEELDKPVEYFISEETRELQIEEKLDLIEEAVNKIITDLGKIRSSL